MEQGIDANAVMADQAVRLIIMWGLQALITAVVYALVYLAVFRGRKGF